MKTTSISINYNLKWQIIFATQYKFTECGKLINTSTNRMLKRTVNCYSKGYWISKKFYTLDNLRKQIELIPKEKEKLPF